MLSFDLIIAIVFVVLKGGIWFCNFFNFFIYFFGNILVCVDKDWFILIKVGFKFIIVLINYLVWCFLRVEDLFWNKLFYYKKKKNFFAVLKIFICLVKGEYWVCC